MIPTPEITLPDGQPTLRMMPMSSDINPRGDIFGGWLMSQIDVAGAIVAHRKAKGAVATVAVKDLLFQSPLFFGDVVSFYASVIKTGKKSITVDIQVYAERMHTILKTAQAVMIYVAVSKPGESRMITG